jgi:hypothetical protein
MTDECREALDLAARLEGLCRLDRRNAVTWRLLLSPSDM